MITGRKVKCELCGQLIRVPDRFHDFPCPGCGAKIHDPHNNKGEGVK